MMNSDSRKQILLFGLKSLWVIFLILIVNFFCFLFLIRNWGEHQDMTPSTLRVLEIGMSVDECAYQLGLPVDGMGTRGQERRATIAMPGVGKFFVVQFRVDLDFDAKDRLQEIRIESGYGLDERVVRVDTEMSSKS